MVKHIYIYMENWQAPPVWADGRRRTHMYLSALVSSCCYHFMFILVYFFVCMYSLLFQLLFLILYMHLSALIAERIIVVSWARATYCKLSQHIVVPGMHERLQHVADLYFNIEMTETINCGLLRQR